MLRTMGFTWIVSVFSGGLSGILSYSNSFLAILKYSANFNGVLNSLSCETPLRAYRSLPLTSPAVLANSIVRVILIEPYLYEPCGLDLAALAVKFHRKVRN